MAAQVRHGDRAGLVLDRARGAVLDLAVHEPRDRKAGPEQDDAGVQREAEPQPRLGLVIVGCAREVVRTLGGGFRHRSPFA